MQASNRKRRAGVRLSVIIVNYNVSRFVEQALRALLASSVKGGMEVFVVDNASQDDSLPYLQGRFPQELYPQVHILAAGGNLGFGRANNFAAKRAIGEYILFLNPDTLPAEDLPQALLDFADGHPDMGAVGVSMTNEDGTFAPESRRGLPTPWTAFCKMSGLNALFPNSRRFGRYYMAYEPKDRVHPTEVVSGACMMVRNDGRGDWFDADYFMYGEDVDLSYRLMQEGKTNYYLPASLVHYKGESTNKTGFRYAHVFYGAMLIFLRKHFPRYAFWLRPVIGLAIVMKAFGSRLHALWLDLCAYLRPGKELRASGSFLYLGKNGVELQKAAQAYGVEVKVVEATEATHPEGHSSLDYEGFDYVVYDLAHFSRKSIIRNLQATAGRIRLGLYDPHTGQLVAHGRQVLVKN